MEPYYRDDGVTLYHGDCRAVAAWCDADVLITDPPYGMDFRSNQRRADQRFAAIAGDADTTLRDEAIALWWDKGPAAVFGTWKAPRPVGVQQMLIWYKAGAGPGMGDLSTPFGTSHEEIYLLGRWERRDGTPRRGSVLTTAVSPSAYTDRVGHPTPKPVGLMETLVEVTAAGVVIADPFAGSGATLIAARNLGRRAIGVEVEERYCELIAGRLAQMALNLEGA